ncbi:MAG: phage scaffolding protein [Clostridium sp.]|nr:phage scaffolding protein [Clostridium sp.]
MEFLKALFGDEALTYDQLAAKVAEGKLNVVNIADGSYVSRNKFDDTVNGLKSQVTDLQGQIAQRDTDLAGLNEQLTAAQADAGQLAEAQKQLSALQSKYDKDSKAWEAKNAQQAYEYAVRSKAGELKFTSAAAKKDFIREAIAQGFKMNGDTLMGYTDFVAKYQENDPGAFVKETPAADPKPADPTPTIVLPGKSNPNPHKMSLAEAMKAKNENPNMEINFES